MSAVSERVGDMRGERWMGEEVKRKLRSQGVDRVDRKGRRREWMSGGGGGFEGMRAMRERTSGTEGW